MSLLELFILAVGLSMDAFAVSICEGLSAKKLGKKHYLIVGAWFGGFQALMPTIGYLLGSTFEQYITSIDHWVAFVLLCLIGGSMVKEARSDDEEAGADNSSFAFKTMLLLAVATSIDALAVGVTFSMVELSVSIWLAVCLIGCTTFLISLGGVYVGNVFGAKYKNKAEFVGGTILILIGVKIILEHFGVL